MSSKRRSRRMAERQNFKKKLAVRCPSCGKVSASSEEEAWEMARTQFIRFGGEEPKRVYSCGDNGKAPFHWTRKERYETALQRQAREDWIRDHPETSTELSDEHMTEEFWLS